MAVSKYSSLGIVQVPLGTEAATVPASLATMRGGFEGRLVLPALDEADMNAKYPASSTDVPVGALCSLTGKDAVYRKGVSGQWVAVWTGGGWVPLTWTPASGFTDQGSMVRADGSVFEALMLVTNSKDISATSYGDLPDTSIGVLPAEYAFSAVGSNLRRNGAYSCYGVQVTGVCAETSGGNVTLLSAWPNAVISANTIISATIGGMMA